MPVGRERRSLIGGMVPDRPLCSPLRLVIAILPLGEHPLEVTPMVSPIGFAFRYLAHDVEPCAGGMPEIGEQPMERGAVVGFAVYRLAGFDMVPMPLAAPRAVIARRPAARAAHRRQQRFPVQQAAIDAAQHP